MSRLPLAALFFLSLLAGCSSWSYRTTQDHARTLGRSGNELSLATGPIRVQFAVPPGWKVISSLDEPLDWDYADDPSGQLSFGVLLNKDSRPMNVTERYQAYLVGIRKTHDPKVRMGPGSTFTLQDGRPVTAYLYSSVYWGQRLVAIIPEGGYSTTFEFSNRSSQGAMSSSQAEIEKILGTYSSFRK